METQQTESNGSQKEDNQNSGGELPQISPRSTKPELVKAYKTLVKKYEENIKNKRTNQTKEVAAKQAVAKASQYTVDNITESLSGLKSDLNRGVDDLAQKLVEEAKKMAEVQRAIGIEKDKLQELYDIKIAAETLEELIETQQRQKEDFDLEYERRKKEREREREEYNYNLAQERKRERAIYEEKQAEFKKREEELAARERELIELRKRVEEFPVKLEQIIKETQEKTAHGVSKKMQIEADLLAREVEGDKRVMETKLQYFADVIAKQAEQIESLRQNLDGANRQVQAIAEKALESSSGKQTLKAVSDIAMRQARKSGGEEE